MDTFKVMGILAVYKHTAQKFVVKRFNLGKLRVSNVRKQYLIEITNRFSALENLNDSKGVKRALKYIKKNIIISARESIGLYKLKQQKPWFDEKCS
jgi:benzoyl-CoA reductase/2-hydroxyglutaryl-CoA dehydratase subunit BcrC/BadD/HgdB